MVSLLAKWKRFAGIIGNFQARFILTVMYFTVFMVPSLIAISKDSLKLRCGNTCWLDRSRGEWHHSSIEVLKRQW